MEITLRGKNYTAEHLTNLNYLPLGNLFIEDDGSFTLADISDYEALNQQRRLKLTKPMMRRLSDPDTKASVAQALAAIFPQLPKDLVSYSGKGEFNLNLTLEELLNISIACGNALTPKPVEERKTLEQIYDEIDNLNALAASYRQKN